MRSTCALVLTMLFACGAPAATPDGSVAQAGGSEAPAAITPAQSSATSAASTSAVPKLCDKADSLRRRLAEVDTKAERAGFGSEVALPESTDGEEVSSMWTAVVVTPKDIRIRGQSVSKPSEVKHKLGGETKVLLALPRGAQGLGRVADVISALGSDIDVYMIAAISGAKVESMPSGVDLGGNENERARVMAEALTKAIVDCSEAKRFFQDLAAAAHEGRAESVKRNLPVAIDKCGCEVAGNTEDLIAFLLAGDPPVIGKKLNASKEKDARAIKLKGLDGQKLYDALPADGSAVRLER